MLDREFFETELDKHAEEKARFSTDGNVTLRLRLMNGETLSVISIEAVRESYVVVEIFPRDGQLREYGKDEREQGAPPYDLDRLAIPFAMITEVEFTTRRPKEQRVGF